MRDQPQFWGKPTRGAKVFYLSGLAGFVIMLGIAWAGRSKPVEVKTLAPGVAVTGQLQLRDIRALRGRFATVIDLRPDGEAADQPPSRVVGANCRSRGIKFAYVPVPHGTIPNASVQALAEAIEDNPKPILLYCRSGKRAVRTYCLAEASRPNGATLENILSAAHGAGQSADDLSSEIKSRIAKRSSGQRRNDD